MWGKLFKIMGWLLAIGLILFIIVAWLIIIDVINF